MTHVIDEPNRLYIMDSEGAEITDEQREVLLRRDLAYITTEAETPGQRQLWLRPIFAVPGDSLDEFPFVADRWMVQQGGRWVAVADWEIEADWFEDWEIDRNEPMPDPRVRDIADPPPTGILLFRDEAGGAITR